MLIKDNIQFNIYAKKVILATGGIGGVFKNTTNQKILNGDSIAIALKHNIKLKNLDYIQIHPTAFFEEEKGERRLLISEAVRGEGAKLIDIKGERFIDELLPRDIVSKAIFDQLRKTNSSYVNLDLTFMNKDYIIKRFPYIYSECLKRGVDITKDYIKVSPAQHYFMGGIEVNLDSKTSLENLYAVGETSCTGVHGANRLASNSLLEGLVFSKKASDSINNTIDDINITIKSVDKIKKDVNDIRKRIQK
ncbi:L-aspartate oxidase [Romboutsia lituseburensis]|uniref:FAD-binding protein n=1 Tax=Romboutsia lituseburensis TaxID=1537 RepID=UPI000E17C346|nr:L-aspartate oxidase [Romboutsia lituseburensis]